MKLNFFILLFVIPFSINAQNQSDFNKIYTKTFLETSHQNPDKALKIADSLYSSSTEPHFKVKSLMLIATLYQQANEIKKSAEFAEKALDISLKSDNNTEIAQVYGLLATQYRRLKFFSRSEEYVQKAIENANKIEDKIIKNNLLGLLTQEQALIEMGQKRYKKAISLLEKSQNYFKPFTPNKSLFLATNEKILGECFYSLNDYDTSLAHYSSALDLIKEHPDTFLNTSIAIGTAASFIKKRDLKNAKYYLDLAKKNIGNAQFLELKKEFYKTSQEYYILEKNIEQLSLLKNKEDSISEVISDKESSFLNLEESKILGKNESLNKKNIFLILLICSFLLLLSAAFVYYRINRKRKPEVNNVDKNPANNHTDSNTEQVQKAPNTLSLKPEVEDKILERLVLFEQSLKFIEKDISLAILSTYCNTNQKYLSITINTHKHKDFNNYINELRIKYLVEKINSDPQYLKFKIASLAEIAGFSTRSKFIEAFKKEMLVPPSVFIKSRKDL